VMVRYRRGLAPVGQPAEPMLSNSIQCGFESHPGHYLPAGIVGAGTNARGVHDQATRQHALGLLGEGRSLNQVSKSLGVSRAALREWRDRGPAPRRVGACPRHGAAELAEEAYAALFGFYLGDGCVSLVRSTYSLRVSCDAAYPGIVNAVADLVVTVRGRGPVGRVSAPGCLVVCAYWNHWPCLFPQHGPGKKHERVLALEPWQEEILAAHPAAFLRGLFHSDGCRVRNWATRTVAGERRRYEYARWQFVNHSTDIQGFCTQALDALEIPWRRSTWKTISVSRRAAVQRLDDLIGPKT
jgi:hypothetical protein